MRAGNEKAHVEVGRAAGAIDAQARIVFTNELDRRIKWLRGVAKPLHKQSWTDIAKVGKLKAVPCSNGSTASKGGEGCLTWNQQAKV